MYTNEGTISCIDSEPWDCHRELQSHTWNNFEEFEILRSHNISSIA